ncbi:unnamed protein product [Lactuca virosa]|uniref:Uncharacterized protein n=1 Tax=Lactuca virosa TaxID=75947 RepID=A0AAU9LED9_9ASTR|nr:unnamed protein product [Lactuca virosa]
MIITSPEAEIEKEMDIEKMDDETESPEHKEEHGLGLHTAGIVMEENAHGDDTAEEGVCKNDDSSTEHVYSASEKEKEDKVQGGTENVKNNKATKRNKLPMSKTKKDIGLSNFFKQVTETKTVNKKGKPSSRACDFEAQKENKQIPIENKNKQKSEKITPKSEVGFSRLITFLQVTRQECGLSYTGNALHALWVIASEMLKLYLDQLSLLGKRITTDLVNELVGVVSDEKLLELLELAMSSNTAETVKRARELMELGVDPMVLMSQMATLIMDIIAGTYQVIEASADSLFDGRSLTEAEIERLKHALKLLSESEKQLRLSSERSTWFTATLFQLGSVPSADPTPSGSSRRQSSSTTEDDPSATFRDIYFQKQRQDSQYTPQKSTPMYPPKPIRQNSPSPKDTLLSMRQLMNGDAIAASSVPHDDDDDDVIIGNNVSKRSNSNILDDIWAHCIEKCHSKTLRQLLHTYGNLVSISEDKGNN